MKNMDNEEKVNKIKSDVLEILSGVVPADNPQLQRDSYMARRSDAGRNLPAH